MYIHVARFNKIKKNYAISHEKISYYKKSIQNLVPRNDNLLDDKTPKALKLPNTW